MEKRQQRLLCPNRIKSDIYHKLGGNFMPTGYTAYIENGEVTNAKDFLTLCLRAFGVCSSMRDESFIKQIPEEFKPNDYYFNAIKKAKKDIDDIMEITDEDLAIKILKERSSSIESYEKSIYDNDKKKKAYKEILHKIKCWEVPKKYLSIKEFAIEQIEMSQEQLDTDFYEKELEKIRQEEISVQEYRAKKLNQLSDMLAYNSKCLQAEIKNIEEKNEFLRGFRESILELG
jgi:hypothetical protein